MVWQEEQNSEFPKTFFREYLFVFVEYLCNCSPKIETKNIKNYSSILAIVNYRNWQDDSLPLNGMFGCLLLILFQWGKIDLINFLYVV